MGDATTDVAAEGDGKAEVKVKKKGVISRIWNALFRPRDDDFEKRLQDISKEEAIVMKRMDRRTVNVKKRVAQHIFISVVLEAIAVSYAIFVTRTPDLHWKIRAIKILPMFVWPVIAALVYSSFVNLTRMWGRKDQKLLERLQAERKAKINELKETTKYYRTQQLIQRYDPDPAAKAAAATVLASKLGAESGLKVFVGEEPEKRIKETEQAQPTGLRKRRQVQPHYEERREVDMVEDESRSDVVVEHHDPQAGAAAGDGGWIARLAALLVGEDPTQSYALICGNCRMHNGLVKKEDFPFVTYYCPHCRALNQPKSSSGGGSASSTPNMRSEVGAFDVVKEVTSTSSSSVRSEVGGFDEVKEVDVVDNVPVAEPEGEELVSKPLVNE